MSNHQSRCSCNLKSEPNNLPVLISGIIVYELAVAIILLIFILWELEKPWCCESGVEEPCDCDCDCNCNCDCKSDLVELSTEG